MGVTRAVSQGLPVNHVQAESRSPSSPDETSVVILDLDVDLDLDLDLLSRGALHDALDDLEHDRRSAPHIRFGHPLIVAVQSGFLVSRDEKR